MPHRTVTHQSIALLHTTMPSLILLVLVIPLGSFRFSFLILVSRIPIGPYS